jgi:hypothetical protein
MARRRPSNPPIPLPLLIPADHVAQLLTDRGGFRASTICDLFNLTAARFGELVGLEAREVTRVVQDDDVRPTRPEIARVLNELVQLASVLQVLGVPRPGNWLQLPLAPYQGASPAALIANGRGQELLADLLDHATR